MTRLVCLVLLALLSLDLIERLSARVHGGVAVSQEQEPQEGSELDADGDDVDQDQPLAVELSVQAHWTALLHELSHEGEARRAYAEEVPFPPWA